MPRLNVLLFLLFAGTAFAQTPPQAAVDPAAPGSTAGAPVHLDADDVAAYVAGVVDAYRRRDRIAGVTVAVVDAQGPLLLQGYGIASQEPERDVTPDRTLFRIGSVSKTFTYLQAMRLLDTGKLALDAPVDEYLPADLALPDDGFKPVLLRHLFTHTAGYEDSAFGHLMVDDPAQSLPLHDYLLRHRPARVREPGVHAVYSNYSVGLLGYVVAQAGGQAFETQVERDLFAPAGMRNTSFREPLVASDARNAAPLADGAMRSDGFERRGGGYVRQGFEHIAQIAPAGAVSSTAQDMARYLRLLLNRGEIDGVRVLPEAVFAKLDGEPLFRTAPEASGFAYGFFRRQYGQVHSLEHGGATLHFHSNLVAVPELGFGVFVSTNTGSGARLAADLPGLLLQRYFARARPVAPPRPSADDATAAAAYAGSYLGERRNYRRFEKLLGASPATITADAKGYLVLTTGEESSRWARRHDDVFGAVEGFGQLVFLRDARGAVSGFVSPRGHDVYDRAGPLDTPRNAVLVLGAAGLASLGVLTGAWLRRRTPATVVGSPRWLTASALAWLVFLLTFALAFAQVAGLGSLAVYAYPTPLLRVALWLAVPALLLTAVNVVQLWRTWRQGYFGFWRAARHTLAVLVFVLAGWTLWVWNAVGWKL